MKALFLAAICALALAGCASQPPDEWKGSTRTPAPSVASASLPEIDGKPFSFKAPKDQVLLVYFGYTSCPDICPTTMADVRLAIEELPESERERVTPVFATVDPSRDTPKKLRGYLGQFFSSYKALRATDPQQLKAAERAFGASHKKGRVDKTGNYPVDHTTFIYLVSDRGQILSELPFGAPASDIANDLKKALG